MEFWGELFIMRDGEVVVRMVGKIRRRRDAEEMVFSKRLVLSVL